MCKRDRLTRYLNLKNIMRMIAGHTDCSIETSFTILKSLLTNHLRITRMRKLHEASFRGLVDIAIEDLGKSVKLTRPIQLQDLYIPGYGLTPHRNILMLIL